MSANSNRADKKAPVGKSVSLLEDDITFEAEPGKKDALFDENEKIVYKVSIRNNTQDKQTGSVGYTILSNNGDKVISQKSVEVTLKKDDSKSVTLSMPAQEAGFYKLNLTINVTDYDDTIRRVFGVSPKKIRSTTEKPADFDVFWRDARDSLARVPMEAKVTLMPNMEKGNTSCYLVEMKSYDNLLVRGWLTIAKNRKPGDKFPVWLVVPGYGGTGVKPIYGSTELAVFAFNCRGQGNSKDKINPTKEGYLTTGIESRYKYIYRGAIMDCIRAVDFIFSRPELDSKNIIISGGSMGGYLAIATASLDKRIKLCSANNPVFCSYRDLVGNKDWPMSDFMKYSKARRLPLEKILKTLDYYDLKYFSPNLTCPSLIGISLLDNLAPPYNEYVMLNNIKAKYKLFVYPNLGHEVPPPLFTYLSNWMMDEFGMF
ncbi:acetylxylan esterase [Mucilaginibacter sp. RS28]|uniref:Acetylxylan esterase n=1 Tax=Mucilaginibacter straminoryzae TaxID=2932774 RepID=A0A9X2BAI8_9SPHI|nr:acetylxylan esterase [Mucilaginibacter straminoryzae]